jgi:hypothetical protein
MLVSGVLLELAQLGVAAGEHPDQHHPGDHRPGEAEDQDAQQDVEALLAGHQHDDPDGREQHAGHDDQRHQEQHDAPVIERLLGRALGEAVGGGPDGHGHRP